MRTFFLLFFCLFSVGISAQLPAVPAEYSFSNREAYQAYREHALEISKAIFTIPPREENEWRVAAARFLEQWLEGNPMVNTAIAPVIAALDKRNPGMRLLYQAGCVRYSLDKETLTPPQQRAAIVLGWMMRYYEEQSGIRRDKQMQAMIRARDEGRLDEWIGKEMGLED